MNFSIRDATVSDFAALRSLREAAIRTFASRYYSERQIEAWLARFAPNGDLTFLTNGCTSVACSASQASRPIGFSSVRLTERPHLWALYVDPELSSQGIGTALLESAELKARETRFDRIWTSASLNAVSFYIQHGYGMERAFELEAQDRHGEICLHAVALEKMLPPQRRLGKEHGIRNTTTAR